MRNKHWKSGFLSSGFPLEYEVAKLLAKNKVAVYSDYCYEREDLGQTKEFSVDIKGSLYFPTSNPNKITGILFLLAECKYRVREKCWIFLPDVNIPDFASGTLGTTIRTIDRFSFSQVDKEPIYNLESTMPFCYKGVEVGINKGDAFDTEIKHGINQLRYALPQLIKDTILDETLSHEEDNHPFYVLPILVTTAALLVLNKNISLDKVEKSDKIQDISQKVPYLILYSSYSPSFKRHAMKACSELRDIGNYAEVSTIERRLRSSGLKYYEFGLPSQIGKALARGDRMELSHYYDQFLVCSFDSLPTLINRLKQAIRASLRKRTTF